MGPSLFVITKPAITGCMLKANLSIINHVTCQLFSRNFHRHHHHLANIKLNHLVTFSCLTQLEVCMMISLGFF